MRIKSILLQLSVLLTFITATILFCFEFIPGYLPHLAFWNNFVLATFGSSIVALFFNVPEYMHAKRETLDKIYIDLWRRNNEMHPLNFYDTGMSNNSLLIEYMDAVCYDKAKINNIECYCTFGSTLYTAQKVRSSDQIKKELIDYLIENNMYFHQYQQQGARKKQNSTPELQKDFDIYISYIIDGTMNTFTDYTYAYRAAYNCNHVFNLAYYDLSLLGDIGIRNKWLHISKFRKNLIFQLDNLCSEMDDLQMACYEELDIDSAYEIIDDNYKFCITKKLHNKLFYLSPGVALSSILNLQKKVFVAEKRDDRVFYKNKYSDKITETLKYINEYAKGILEYCEILNFSNDNDRGHRISK